MEEDIVKSHLIGKWQIWIRWILFVPAICITYGVAKLVFDWGFADGYPDVVHDVVTTGGINGHYIMGPVFVFLNEAFATWVAILVGISIVPKYKEYVFFLAGILICALIISSIFIHAPNVITDIISAAGEVTGFALVGFYVWKRKRQDTKSNNEPQQLA